MSTALEETLLDNGGEAAPRIYRRIVVASAAIAVLLLSASFVGYPVGKSSGEAVNFATVNDDLFGNYPKLGELSEMDSCYSYLGSKCEGITDKRCTDYNALCVENECACPDGCAGGDGICYNDKNTKLNKQPLLITNLAYPDWYLYLSEFMPRHMFRVSRWFAFFDHGYRFNLYKLPGGRYNGHNLFYLTLEHYPTWAATIRPSPDVRTDLSDYGMYGVNLDNDKPHTDPQGIAVRVCSMERLANVKAVKIGRTMQSGHGVWASVQADSMLVYGWDTKAKNEEPGSKGYWVLSEPDILGGLEDCEA